MPAPCEPQASEKRIGTMTNGAEINKKIIKNEMPSELIIFWNSNTTINAS